MSTATVLKLVDTNEPYRFRSLGVMTMDREYVESTLFPIGTEVELTSGKFPLNNYRNLYNRSNMTHVIGGKTVRIVGFSNDCQEGELNKYGGCQIRVIEHVSGGNRRGRSGRRSTRRRSTRRRSIRRRY
jgi:hypothetical protein